jgi:hypothetical protein
VTPDAAKAGSADEGEVPGAWSRPWHALQRSLAADVAIQSPHFVRRNKLPRHARFGGGAVVCWLARARAMSRSAQRPHDR